MYTLIGMLFNHYIYHYFIFSNLTFLFFFTANKKSIIDGRVLDNISNNVANA